MEMEIGIRYDSHSRRCYLVVHNKDRPLNVRYVLESDSPRKLPHIPVDLFVDDGKKEGYTTLMQGKSEFLAFLVDPNNEGEIYFRNRKGSKVVDTYAVDEKGTDLTFNFIYPTGITKKKLSLCVYKHKDSKRNILKVS